LSVPAIDQTALTTTSSKEMRRPLSWCF